MKVMQKSKISIGDFYAIYTVFSSIETQLDVTRWYQRLGYSSFKILFYSIQSFYLPIVLAKQNLNKLLVHDQPNKSHRLSFSTISLVSKYVLVYIYSDIRDLV